MNRTLALILAAAALCACGGSEFDDASAGDATAADATARYLYKCPGMHRYVAGTDVPMDFWISLSGRKARDANTQADLKTAADLLFDTGWSITSSAREYVRFKGTVNGMDYEIRVEPDLRKGGYQLRNGSKGGYAKIIGRAGEGYDSWSGICFRQ